MSEDDTRSRFERVFGIPLEEHPLCPPDTIFLIDKTRGVSEDEQRRQRDVLKWMRQLVHDNPLTVEGIRTLDGRRFGESKRTGPPMHNIPMPRTPAGDPFRELVRSWRAHAAAKMVHYGSPPGSPLRDLELRILSIKTRRPSWTHTEYLWRDGEE